MSRAKMRISAAVMLAAAFGLGGCGGDDGAPAAQGPLRFSEVLATAYSGVLDPRQVAVDDAGTWASLWSEHASDAVAPPPQPIDFSTQTVAALFSGVSSGCQHPQVQAVEVTGVPSVRVTYHLTEPSASAACAAAVTTPVHAVRFDNPLRLPVEFRLAGDLGAQPPLLGETVGADCFGAGCRADDAATLGGSCFGHSCGAGFAENSGGKCVGDGCQAGNGKTVGGDCYGARCKAGNAWNRGGDCYGEGCTPGHGGTSSGGSHPDRNIPCLLGEITQVHRDRAWSMSGLENWATPPGAACLPVWTRSGEVAILAIRPPSPPPPLVVITPLPPDPWDPENLPKCPYTCQAYNPASGTCVGAAHNWC